MNAKEEFIQIYKENIHREGADAFLEFLEGVHSDFFTAPASTRFHGNMEGGLCEHSVHVYHCLKDYLSRQRVQDTYNMHYSDETIALVALLHDVCKINVYKKGTRNKKIDGEWHQVDVFEFEDNIPFGHGEKSVYMIQPFMRITREEAFAIRYHMGFSGSDPVNNVGKAFEYGGYIFFRRTSLDDLFFLYKKTGKNSCLTLFQYPIHLIVLDLQDLVPVPLNPMHLLF